MKITSITAEKIALGLTRPYSIAYKTVTDVSICKLVVQLENGWRGLGACNPSKQVVGEGLDDTLAALTEERLAPLIGRDIRHLPQLCQDIQTLFPMMPGVQVALDIAFHDLFSRYLDVPLVDYLGRKHKSMATSITIGIKNVEGTLEEAQEYRDRGFRILKVKLGNDLHQDLARLKALRATFGNQMGIRVDANQGYSAEEVRQFHTATAGMELELVEQPMPAQDIGGMKALPEEVRHTIAADESLIHSADADVLAADPKACGVFNIKLMKCGGIYEAMRIAEVARLRNIALMWGCNDESIISITAALHAAFACANTRYIDLDGSLDLAEDIVSGGFVIKDGMMSIAGGPGLGLKEIR
ncbi:MAG: dipeptide epimerase [Bacteroidota bacterium]